MTHAQSNSQRRRPSRARRSLPSGSRRGPTAAAMACTQKFGAPLYAGVFLNDELLLLGGGGGKKSSGIANRCARAEAAAPAYGAPCVGA